MSPAHPGLWAGHPEEFVGGALMRHRVVRQRSTNRNVPGGCLPEDIITMELAIVGLGRMGMNMLQRLAEGGHTVFGFDTSPDKKGEVEKRGGAYVGSLDEALGKFTQSP